MPIELPAASSLMSSRWSRDKVPDAFGVHKVILYADGRARLTLVLPRVEPAVLAALGELLACAERVSLAKFLGNPVFKVLVLGSRASNALWGPLESPLPLVRREQDVPKHRRSAIAAIEQALKSLAFGLALLLLALAGCAPTASAPARPSPLAPTAPAVTAASAPPGPAIPLDAALLLAAEEEKPRLLADLASLVAIDSGTDDEQGLSRMAAWFSARLKELGADVALSSAAPSLGETVHATFHGTGTRNLMLMVHLDTVFKHGEAAKRPYRSEGNRAFGPGVADAKGGAALIVHALALLRQRDFAGFHTLTVLLNPDEEKGSFGSRALIRQLASEADAVLSFEPPPAERVIVATSGIAFVELSVKGRAAHAGSAPEEGRNAALELANQVLKMRELGDAGRGTTVNWTVLASGERANIIPDTAHATADMRLTEPSELVRVQRDVTRLSRDHLIPDTEVSATVELRRPAFARNPESEKLAALAARVYAGLGKSLEPVAMRFGTDAGFAYQAGSAKPAVLEGLGIVGAALHSRDEWADLDSVVPRLYLAVQLVELLSGPSW